MSCCYLIGSMPFDFKTEGCARPAEDDLVICADGGYDRAQEQGILPDILVGDFDSANGYPADLFFWVDMADALIILLPICSCFPFCWTMAQRLCFTEAVTAYG